MSMTEDLLLRYTNDVLRRIRSPTELQGSIIQKELLYISRYMNEESDWPNDEDEFSDKVYEHISPHFKDCIILNNGDGVLHMGPGEDDSVETLVRYLIIAGVRMWGEGGESDEER
jgi:hypothetical protein